MTITAQSGGLGRSQVGPNLAGLLSEFYPRPYGNAGRWTATTLKAWLDNPRASRPLATMQPVRISREEYALLVSQLAR